MNSIYTCAWLLKLFPGGVERMCHEMSKNLVDNALDVNSICANTLINKKQNIFEHPNYEVTDITIPFHPYLLNAKYKHKLEQYFLRRTTHFLKRRKEAAIFHGFGMDALPGIKANLKTVATIIGLRGHTEEYEVIKNSNMLIAPANGVAKILMRSGVPENKIKVVHQGVNINYFKNADVNLLDEKYSLDLSRSYIVTAHNLVEKKATELLITAFDEIGGKFPDYDLIIGGGGPRKRFIQTCINNCKHKERIHLLDFFGGDLLKSVYKIADIFVLPGKEEKRDTQLPNVIYEAMANGLPIIASDVGCIYEVLHHEKNGLLVKQNSADSIKNSIIKFIEDDSLSNRLAVQAQKDALQYDWNNVTRRILRIYEELI